MYVILNYLIEWIELLNVVVIVVWGWFFWFVVLLFKLIKIGCVGKDFVKIGKCDKYVDLGKFLKLYMIDYLI